MSKNDQIVLKNLLLQLRESEGGDVSESDHFEIFAAEQILKDLDLGHDELESGITGGGQDGGVDGFYLLVDQELMREDSDMPALKKGVDIQLVLVQAKITKGFKETPIERFITFSKEAFDLEKDIDEFSDILSDAICSRIAQFRGVFGNAITKKPNLRISFYYASQGMAPEDSVSRKSKLLIEEVEGFFSDVKISCDFYGASELMAQYRKEPQKSFSLKLAENPVSVDDQEGCFVSLVNLVDYYRFISNDRGDLRRDIFEANVRDYQGKNEVNKQIQESLKNDVDEDFWWLNNGITVVADSASSSSKILSIEGPQIVNGLQTSREIFDYLKGMGNQDDDALFGVVKNRRVLVRVVVPTDEASRDNIIRSTNSQTSVQIASLRSTDKIHRDIEDYLKGFGIFYDRRKNYYKNEGKETSMILSVSSLAQAVTTLLLKQPHVARARPSSLLKKDDEYRKVFGENMPVAMYHGCAAALMFVTREMKKYSADLSQLERNNLKFFFLLDFVMSTLSQTEINTKDLSEMKISDFSTDVFAKSVSDVKRIFNELGGTDKVAKSASMTVAIGAQFTVTSESE